VDARVTQHAWHLYMATYDPDEFGGRPCAEFLAMLRAEGIPCSPGYVPLNRTPALRRALAEQRGQIDAWDMTTTDLPLLPPCPVAEDLGKRTIWLKQSMFLGDYEDMDDIVAAIVKVQEAVA
jgi:dTDP-4-amino-4,6-dideoxygalactose transaminase